MTRVHLVRHGAVDPSFRGRVYGDLDIDLSDHGRAQSARLPERFAAVPLHAVYSSDLRRAAYAAEGLAAARGVPHRWERRLREVFRGDWRERTWQEIEARWPGEPARFVDEPNAVMSHGGESLGDVSRRALAALDDILPHHPDGHIAIVAHTWVIRSILCHALDLPLQRCTRLQIATASISTIDLPHPTVHQTNLKDPTPLLGSELQ